MKALGLFALAVPLAFSACAGDSPVAPPRSAPDPSALSSHADHGALVVDDDGAECSNAGYETIQDAVNAAAPNATIHVCAGTYRERVVIEGPAKNGLRLLAQGAPDRVVLDGDNPSPVVPGNHGFHLLNVTGVLIQGFTLREYFENIRLTGSADNRIRKNRTTAAGHDGITLVGSVQNVIEHNISFDNLSGNACGVLLAGGSARNLVAHNTFRNNNWGVRILAGSTANHIFGNESHGNRSRGIQNIDIAGAAGGTLIENNRTDRNPVGIDIQSSGVTVARNKAFHNSAFDLVDGGANNDFVNNHCVTSSPPGLCAHTEGRSR